MVDLGTLQILLYAVGIVAVITLTIFACWVLIESARFLHRINRLAQDTEEKIVRMSAFMSHVAEAALAGKEIISLALGLKKDRKKNK